MINAALYRQLKADHFRAHPLCVRCGKKATDIHHTRGRLGELLTDMRHWRSLCRVCHQWAHQNIAEARKVGLICEKGKWNSVDKG